MGSNKTDIVITSYQRGEFTRTCIENIVQHTTTPYRIIVVDNGSNQETKDALWELEDKGMINILVLLDKNYGLEPAKNLGLQFVKSDRYVDTDNDILCPPYNWLEKLHKLMDKDEKLAALACSPQVFIGANKKEMFAKSGKVLERNFVGGSLRLMNTKLVKELGGWRSEPKDMIEANRGEEHYICGKIREAGYKVGYSRDIECFHLFGEGEWGYPEGVEHYHRAQWPVPTDSIYGRPEDWYDKF